MGLDWLPLPKPKDGCGAEFEDLWRQLNEADGSQGPAGKPSFWSSLRLRLGSNPPAFDRDAAIARFQEISIPPYANLGAPVVGRDPEADAWVKELYENDKLKVPADTMLDKVVADFAGYHVIELLPVCDGFPIYTHADLYDGVDRTSFRGKFLESCADVIGDDLLDQAWTPLLAPELADYGRSLSRCAERFAAEHSLAHVLNNRAFDWDDEGDPASQLHVVDQAARWCIFWSDRGHGLEPYF